MVISIHALREEGDFEIIYGILLIVQFLSTPSARRATYYSQRVGKSAWISIHALREEGDRRPSGHAPGRSDFYPRPPRGGRPLCGVLGFHGLGISIHALREEGDREQAAKLIRDALFLSTPSARRPIQKLRVLTMVRTLI